MAENRPVHPVPGEAEIGERLTLRLHDPDGGYRDIVGVLESGSSLKKRDGSLVTFDPSRIAVWRRIPPPDARAGHGAPLSIRIREIELTASATWPARDQEHCGEWILRANDGLTMRANSALAVGNPGMPIREAIEHVKDFYKTRGLPPTALVALPTYAELDELLSNSGWSEKIHVLLMVADLTDHEMAPAFAWHFDDEPDHEWLSLQGDYRVEEIMRRAPASYASLKVDGEIVAVGRAAANSGWSVLSRLYVKEQFRGKGIGRDLVQALAHHARTEGISKTALQVDSKNARAIRLYESMGYRTHHTFVYRVLLSNGDEESSC